jgi:hypothetical protein
MNQIWRLRVGMALGIFLMLIVVTAGLASLARAVGTTKSRTNSSDSVTLSVSNGPTFTYSGTTPQFKATVVLAQKLPANYLLDLIVDINGKSDDIGGTPTSQSSDGLTYYYVMSSLWSSFTAVGTYSAVAVFTNPATGITTYSNTASFTINKGTPSLQCMMTNWNQVITPGYALTIQMTPESGNPSAPVDWQNATYTIKFVGPITVTRSNLAPGSNDVVTAPAPEQTGSYTEVDCIFNGSTLFTSATTNAAGQPVLVSEEKSMGGVQLYTNPTTLASNRPADMYVVFHAASGGPTPTGRFNIDFGSNYSSSLTIGANGTLLVHFNLLPNLSGVSQVTISYHGDPYYNQAVFKFPLTNPPIPGTGGGSGGGSGGQPTSTPAPTATSSPTETANGSSFSVTPTAGSSGTPLVSSVPISQTNSLLWILLAALAILGVSGSGFAFVVARRARASAAATRRLPNTVPATPTATADSSPSSNPED